MTNLQQFKCPNCGGAIQFDSHTGKPRCPYCATEFDIETLESYDNVIKETEQEPIDFETGRAGQQWEDEAKVKTYVCKDCGGAIITDSDTVAQTCPYCGNPVVIVNNVAGNLKPDKVIPFKLDKEAAMEAFHNHLKNKPLLPKQFKQMSFFEEVKGIYVPFWLYDADVNASARYRATRSRSWSDGDYMYTETNYYAVYRQAEIGFDNVPVDGSTKIDATVMQSIEPFDMSEAVDFNTAYLAGYFADKYNIDSNKSSSEAYYRIRNSAENALESTVMGFDRVSLEGINIGLDNSDIKYVLYPVWLLTANYEGKTYTFAMNGQTGKFVGDLPVDNGAFWGGMITKFALISGLIYGAQWLMKLLTK